MKLLDTGVTVLAIPCFQLSETQKTVTLVSFSARKIKLNLCKLSYFASDYIISLTEIES